MSGEQRLILLTGATGYMGGRLLRVLEERSVRLRCLARRSEFLRRRVSESTEVVKGDVFDPESLDGALAGMDSAYYLVHSMGSGGDLAKEDRIAAQSFARATQGSGAAAGTRDRFCPATPSTSGVARRRAAYDR